MVVTVLRGQHYTELPYQIWQKRNDLSAFEICKEATIKYIEYLDQEKMKKVFLP
jgi:hypothetical protein